MRRRAIIAGKSGKAEFGWVEVPDVNREGLGKEEPRPVSDDFGPWHTSKDGVSTILYVVEGEWVVKVHGETITFPAGSVVVSQDFGVGDDNGHCSRASGSVMLRLFKLDVDGVFEIVA